MQDPQITMGVPPILGHLPRAMGFDGNITGI